MNESIRPDKEDRYFSENPTKKTLSPKFDNRLLSKTKWIILILALLIIILLLSFILFKPQSPAQSATANDPELAASHDPKDLDYQALVPPKISRDATETKQNTEPNKERIEIPGEVIDTLANKINELGQQEQDTEIILLEDQNGNMVKKANELQLQKTLESDHYTIQITSSSSLESIMAFVKQQKLSNYQIYETRREQKPWFVLIKGNYATIEEAKEATKLLPQDLQKNTPWIKSGAQVNKEKLSK